MMVQIYGTLGPSCREEPVLVSMFEAGLTGMRLNLSHTSLPESRELIETYHRAAGRCGVTPGLLIDMQGPELRIGKLEKPRVLSDGDTVDVPMPDLVLSALRKGDLVLIDDGKLEADVVEVKSGAATLTFRRGGKLERRKSIKIEGKEITGPALTDHDRKNLALAGEYGVTAVMEPFVTGPETLRTVRMCLRENGLDDAAIFAKIENLDGVRNLPAILPEADMIVIARGDLGNDMPLWHLPAVQKEISAACREAGKSFMVVTQMLTSMIHHPYPTRAEVSDIFNAVADGASAVMVTNETAVGSCPAEVIRYLTNTAREAEKWRTTHP